MQIVCMLAQHVCKLKNVQVNPLTQTHTQKHTPIRTRTHSQKGDVERMYKNRNENLSLRKEQPASALAGGE